MHVFIREQFLKSSRLIFCIVSKNNFRKEIDLTLILSNFPGNCRTEQSEDYAANIQAVQ